MAKIRLLAKLFQNDFANSELLAKFPLLLRFLQHFSPKNPNFIYPNPKFDRKHYLRLFYNLNINLYTNTWTFYTINNQLLHVLQSISIQNLIPKFTKQQQNYMLNSVSELYHLRLENISPTLTHIQGIFLHY